VITINLNSSTGLQETARSVDEQRYGKIEHIVQDGLSTDDSIRLISHEKTSNRQIFQEADNGIYDAMNKALLKVHGDLVIFLNAGDIFASQLVLAQVGQTYMEKDFLWAAGSVCPQSLIGYKRRKPLIGRNFFLLSLGLRIVPHPATFYSARLLRQVGFFSPEMGLAADQHFALRAWRIKPPLVLPLVVAIFDESGVSSRLTDHKRGIEFRQIRRNLNLQFLRNDFLDLSLSLGIMGARRIVKGLRTCSRH